VEKLREVTHSGLKAIGAHALNLGALFEFLLLKIVEGTPVPGGVCVVKPYDM